VNWLDWICALMATGGGFFILVGGIGALRMPDLYTRMHASSLTDTLGSMLILGALMLQGDISLTTVKLAAILVFLLFTSPVASYALGNAALLSGHEPLVPPERDDRRNAAGGGRAGGRSDGREQDRDTP
jgi:multicomponent Na+:H+ antiporter subunit G